jgi:serum/glucocorticoid-regulated kinase 2
MAEPANPLDQLSLLGEKIFMKILAPDEHLVLSCKVLKYNKRNKAQERNFALTNKAIYNLKGKKNKRKIELEAV